MYINKHVSFISTHTLHIKTRFTMAGRWVGRVGGAHTKLIRRTPLLAGCSRAYEIQCTRLEHEGSIIIARDRGPHRPRPFRRPQSPNGCIPALFRGQKRPTNTQKQHPSAAPGPFSQTGCPRLCSLYVVIRMFLCDFGYGKTRKSHCIASRDGESLSG